jgi:DNA-binding MarR family transcriptional regulator
MAGHWQPDRLALHLDANAAAWGKIVGDVDSRTIGIFGRLEAIARSLADFQRRALAPYQINYAELTTIGMLRTSPPGFRRSPTELRRLVGQSSAGMTRILTKLERGGLVRREAQAEDGRRVEVILTARGRKLAERSFLALYAAQRALLGRLGSRRPDDLMRALDEAFALLAPEETELDGRPPPLPRSRRPASSATDRAPGGARRAAGSPPLPPPRGSIGRSRPHA